MFSYVIEVADSESDFGLHSSTLDSEICVLYQGVHDHDVVWST